MREEIKFYNSHDVRPEPPQRIALMFPAGPECPLLALSGHRNGMVDVRSLFSFWVGTSSAAISRTDRLETSSLASSP